MDKKMTIKMVVNRCYGGFSISEKAIRRLRELGCEAAKEPKVALKGETDKWGQVNTWIDNSFRPELERSDPLLVQVVEELGKEANGQCSELEVVEVTINIDIDDYDGMETVGVSGGCYDLG